MQFRIMRVRGLPPLNGNELKYEVNSDHSKDNGGPRDSGLNQPRLHKSSIESLNREAAKSKKHWFVPPLFGPQNYASQDKT
jgi:hypothetical protein